LHGAPQRAFSKDNADYLQTRGINPTFADLRLAFLLGPADAVRVLQRPAQTPVSEILSRAVIRANPFMTTMTAPVLIDKCARHLTRESSPAVAQATDGLVWLGIATTAGLAHCTIATGGWPCQAPDPDERAARGLPSRRRDIGRPEQSRSVRNRTQWWSAELWCGRHVLLASGLSIGVRHVFNAAVNGAAAAIAFISLLLLAAWLWSVSYGL
jgi:hypothetical protein